MNRLKEIRAFLGLTQQEFADKIDEKLHKINDIERGKQKIGVDLAEKIQEKFPIDAWWLLTGKGSMHISGTNVTNMEPNSLSIPLVSHSASAGRGNHIGGIQFEVVETMTISRTLFKTPPLSTVRIIKVDGYSMTPMLYPDSYCIFDECGEFKTDGLYIINYGNELMVKLLQLDPDGNLHIKSTNQDYQSWIIKESDQTHCRIIGKVLRIII